MNNLVNLKIEYLKGKHSIKNMDSSQKLSFLETFNDSAIKDIQECAEHIIARRNGKSCHLADF